jgi:hypothetical protein
MLGGDELGKNRDPVSAAYGVEGWILSHESEKGKEGAGEMTP